MTDDELRHLRRCVELATEALEAGDEPFGSVLVAADGTVGEHCPMCAAAHGWVGLGRPGRRPHPPLPRRRLILAAGRTTCTALR